MLLLWKGDSSEDISIKEYASPKSEQINKRILV